MNIYIFRSSFLKFKFNSRISRIHYNTRYNSRNTFGNSTSIAFHAKKLWNKRCINPWQRPISHTSGTGRSPFRSLINQSFLARKRERERNNFSAHKEANGSEDGGSSYQRYFGKLISPLDYSARTMKSFKLGLVEVSSLALGNDSRCFGKFGKIACGGSWNIGGN